MVKTLNIYILDDDYFEKGLGTSFIKGIPGTFEDLKKREEEYSHNRKAEYKPKSNIKFSSRRHFSSS